MEANDGGYTKFIPQACDCLISDEEKNTVWPMFADETRAVD